MQKVEREQDTKQATNEETPESFRNPLLGRWCVELTNTVQEENKWKMVAKNNC